MLLIGASLSAAGTLPVVPPRPATVPGECVKSVGINIGTPIPPLLVGDDSLARCSSVAEPLSSYAHLLLMEKHAWHVRQRYEVDTEILRADVQYWQTKAESHKKLITQPWFVAVTTSLLVSGAWLTYNGLAGGQ